MSGSLVSFFPNLTVEQSLSLSLQGLGPEIEDSPAFDQALLDYGFNKNSNSPNHFANYSKQFFTGSLGNPCSGNDGSPLN